MLKHVIRLFFLFFLWSNAASANTPFEHGWSLDTSSSTIGFLSVKKGTIAEYSGFASFSGSIDEQGAAEISVALDSVDTKIDLRNVRMRFLFFETFKQAEAKVTASINADDLSDLAELRRKTIDLPVTVFLHGLSVDVTTPVALTLLDNDQVNVSTVQPIILSLADFDLLAGLGKLEEAAGVTITPVGIVSLDLNFIRNKPGTALVPVATTALGAATALETEGTFNRDECVGRFEILSQSRSLNFAPSTATITQDGRGFLDLLSDVVNRCPELKIEVGGHTDSWGKDQLNLELSRKRAAAVAEYLVTKGSDQDRLVAVGYGEAQPLVDNSTSANRAKNRRIEFKVLN